MHHHTIAFARGKYRTARAHNSVLGDAKAGSAAMSIVLPHEAGLVCVKEIEHKLAELGRATFILERRYPLEQDNSPLQVVWRRHDAFDQIAVVQSNNETLLDFPPCSCIG